MLRTNPSPAGDHRFSVVVKKEVTGYFRDAPSGVPAAEDSG
ncbi:MAG: hypothetical protein ABIG63_06095 [Chloroflexota bacterium]